MYENPAIVREGSGIANSRIHTVWLGKYFICNRGGESLNPVDHKQLQPPLEDNYSVCNY